MLVTSFNVTVLANRALKCGNELCLVLAAPIIVTVFSRVYYAHLQGDFDGAIIIFVRRHEIPRLLQFLLLDPSLYRLR